MLTGVLIGLGAATKLYPALLLGALLVIAWRDRRWRDLAGATAGAAVAWVLVDLPAYLSGPRAWTAFWQFNDTRAADLGSLWMVAHQALAPELDPSTINDWSLVLLGAWCAGVLVLGLRAPRTPRLAQLGLLVMVGFVLVNKVYSPQYVLWLLPLAALARPYWRDLATWFAGEVLYFVAVWAYLGGSLQPADRPVVYWLAILVRVLAQLFLAAVVVRDVLHPSHDRVLPEQVPSPQHAGSA